MTKSDAKKRIDKLKVEINHQRYLYHVKDTQELSDAALDSLKKELFDLEQEFPDLVTPDSPTQRVAGKPLPQFTSVKHRQRMLSLQDAFSLEDLQQWEKRNMKIVNKPFSYFVELKIDGVAMSLLYEDGQLVRAATRGNGFEGEDVTLNIRTIESVPLQLIKPIKGLVEVRGEVYILKKDFEKMNEQRVKRGEALFANPRNIAAGSIRQLDPRLAAARPLRFFAWEITEGVRVTTRDEEYEQLQQLGFAVPPNAVLCKNLMEVDTYLQSQEKRRLNYTFLVDGAVLKINDLVLSKHLGVIGKAPRGSIAYKFAAEEATTIVEDIVVQIGRTSVLTPVAYLKPVAVAGTTISRATLHNADEVQRKDVRVGDTVVVRKAGDIIPEVVKVLPQLRSESTAPFTMPDKCPMCGAAVTKEADGVAYRCSNTNCFPVQREKILHAISGAGFDLEGFGDKIIEQLLQEGLIKDAADVWQLKVGDLLPLERFAQKKADKLVKEAAAKKEISLSRFLAALGIPHVGTVTAQDLARSFKTLDVLQHASIDQLTAIEGVGEKVAQSVQRFLESQPTKKLIKKYLKAGITIEAESSGGILEGKTFVFTGSLGALSRDEAKQEVVSRGGKVASTVGKTITYLVAGEDAGSKYARAKKLGIPILTPAAFQKMLKK